MVFSSLIFIYAFLPLSLLCYMLCGSLKAKNISLLVFSLIFYAWGEPKYVLLLMLMAAVDWFCALRIDIGESAGERKLWLALAVFVDLLLIGVFKYAGLVCSIFGEVPAFVQRIALPIGISMPGRSAPTGMCCCMRLCFTSVSPAPSCATTALPKSSLCSAPVRRNSRTASAALPAV